MSGVDDSGGEKPEDVPRRLRGVYEEVTTYDEGTTPDNAVEIQQLEELLEQNPGNHDVMEWLAFKVYSVGHYDRAVKLYRELIDKGHRLGVQYFYLGNAYYKMNRSKQAVEAWRQTLSLIPTDPKAQKARARIEKVERNETAM
jgi:cytochrome c-type biogenesis protein CcmH/NrfG